MRGRAIQKASKYSKIFVATQSCDLANGGEHMSQVSTCSFNAITMIDAPLSSFCITVKLVKVVVKVHISGT